ncbi:MAG: hypothetical protein QM657_07705 [Lacrimispora sp.]
METLEVSTPSEPTKYYAGSLDEAVKEFANIESRYITDRFNIGNHFYIDHENVLWGTGQNEYWQLGIPKEEDRNELAAIYSTPVMIAENVIHVDASENGYFMIFLTEDHKLYGMGSNRLGVLRLPLKESEEGNYHLNITAEPVLLMENVLFASAGRESISVLTEDNNVWWWGRFNSTTGTDKLDQMYSETPLLMVENAKYTVCGADMAAAIDQNNNLWTWGNNVWGQCGIRSERDYLREAQMVCSEVDMVWLDMLNSKQNRIPSDDLPDFDPYDDVRYSYTTFIRKEDGELYACGINLGTEEKTVNLYGDILASDQEDKSGYTFNFSAEFLEVGIKSTDKK